MSFMGSFLFCSLTLRVGNSLIPIPDSESQATELVDSPLANDFHQSWQLVSPIFHGKKARGLRVVAVKLPLRPVHVADFQHVGNLSRFANYL